MLTKTQSKIIEALKNQDLKPRSYSGRGMYGERCIGVSVDYPGNYEFPKGWKMDTLGMGYIVYWPGVPWPEGYKDED